MIDVHIHILPGIDDGARSLNDTLEMAKIAAANGFTDIIATPHCNIPGRYSNYFGESYKTVFQIASNAIRQAGISVCLHPGMEVYMTDKVPELIRKGKIVTLNCSHYLLVEFNFRENPSYVDYMLDKIAKMGLIPVIAHVERYHFLQKNLNMAENWKKKGYVIQVNKASYLGKFGTEEEITAHYLTERGYVDVIATDAHRPNHRTPDMEEFFEEFYMEYPESYMKKLLVDNPHKICMDQKII